ncbi:SpoIIE family protein phosphatase [Streptomyces sp. NPDC001815]|uniref:PP2C family protein-serine/threonine phosphatase n=1 Tax=unclassified Streptomyces TaxID=2593676 RepID=UPI00331F5C82
MTRTWHITTVTDAARARIDTARLAAAYGVSGMERTRLTAALSAHLRQCLAKGGTWRLDLAATTTPPQDSRLRAEVTSCDGAGADARTPWHMTVACAEGVEPTDVAGLGADDPETLAEALLGADEDTVHVLRKLGEQEDLVTFHREELHQTNQGVLALHAELDAAGRTQRDLFAAERAARTEAENARRRLTFLADASAVLTASLNHDEIVRRLQGLLVPEYARSVDVWLFDGEDDEPVHTPRPAAAVVAARSGRPQYAADHPGGLSGVDDQPPSTLHPAVPLLCIPLPTRRSPLGVLILSPPGERWDADDAVMLIELTRRASIAMDNARRYEHNRDIAETLQRALLTDLPPTPGLRLAARYLPATHGLNIGGDWYDAFRQPDGSLITVIGDVTGHGLHAAVMMSQLRTALRAYAVDGGSPGQLLTRLHIFLHHLQPDLYATAVIARFHPEDPTLTWAAAGHPPPVLRTPDGQVHTLDAKPGAMLGIPLKQEIHDHTVTLTPGSTLALYTDGLVERRAQGIDPGIARLATALGTFRSADLDADLDGSADSLLHPLLSDSERDDDVCLLLCHLHSRAAEMARPSPTGLSS